MREVKMRVAKDGTGFTPKLGWETSCRLRLALDPKDKYALKMLTVVELAPSKSKRPADDDHLFKTTGKPSTQELVRMVRVLLQYTPYHRATGDGPHLLIQVGEKTFRITVEEVTLSSPAP